MHTILNIIHSAFFDGTQHNILDVRIIEPQLFLSVLLGVEDIKIVQTSTFTALVVAVANADTCLENSCTPEEMLTFEQSNSAGNVRICGCAYAIKTSFAIMFSKSAKKFALDVNQPSFFQFLKVGPEMVKV